jgi:glyoxylase-like metal-dependent hydrolase (beta-lactamase superfamily II)
MGSAGRTIHETPDFRPKTVEILYQNILMDHSIPFSQPFQIDLAIPALIGFSDFIGCWFMRTECGFILVDPGPTATIPTVVAYLKQQGISSLAAILLTHIHVDHAGGVGTLSALYPETPIICPARSIPHLIDPARLEQSSRTVLGPLMDHYGPINPVPEHSLSPAESSPWGAISTPGHSPDHTAYLINGFLFCGEALGVICALKSSTYRRPATPPRFEKKAYLESIAKLEAVKLRSASAQSAAPHTACFGHFGSLDWSDSICAESRAQIELWIDIIASDPTASDETIIGQLLKEDPLYAEWRHLPESIREREMIFVKNSVSGIRDYVKRQ